MNKVLPIVRWPFIVSLIAVVPIIVVELINQPASRTDFPFMLFFFLWIIPFLFCLTLFPMVRRFNVSGNMGWNIVVLVSRIVLLCILSVSWYNLMSDQMPCFLGVPNCD